ncbi:hypothetical protein B0H14DRAFT_2643057 [Mycena olivaceomarginata]|nr:hypothetical protein B0H14DRAFT_2643057 [Mycena olivaceomarginata]
MCTWSGPCARIFPLSAVRMSGPPPFYGSPENAGPQRFGKSSGVNLVNAALDLTADVKHNESQNQHFTDDSLNHGRIRDGDETWTSRRPQYWTGKTRDDTTRRPHTLEFPPDTLMNSLVELYFARQHIYLRLLHICDAGLDCGWDLFDQVQLAGNRLFRRPTLHDLEHYYLRFCFSPFITSAPRTQSVALYCAFYHLQVVIHRPFIPVFRPASTVHLVPAGKFVIGSDYGRLLADVVDVQRRHGFVARREIANVRKCMEVVRLSENRSWEVSGILGDILAEFASVCQVPPSHNRAGEPSADNSPLDDPGFDLSSGPPIPLALRTLPASPIIAICQWSRHSLWNS